MKDINKALKLEKPCNQTVLSYNEKYLSIKEIQENSYTKVPDQTIVIYKNALLTPTNHLYVKGKYIPTGLISTYDDKKLSKYQQIYLYLKFRYLTSHIKHTGKHLYAHDLWLGNYYHWMCEWLPRAYALHKYHYDGTYILPAHFMNAAFITEPLKILGIPYAVVDQKAGNSFEELITVHSEPLRAYINPFLQKELRSRIFEKLGISHQTGTKKIYISRGRAKYRKIENEAEVLKIVEDAGFEVIFPEDLNFEQQVRLFSQASHLVGIHGAGHTNMMFMPAGSKVMEIRNSEIDSQPFCFWRLANIFDLCWSYFQAKPVTVASNFDNVIVDIDSFNKELLNFQSDKQFA